MYMWEPLESYLWYMNPRDWPMLTVALYLVHVLCWLIILGQSLTMDICELVGLKQVSEFITET